MNKNIGILGLLCALFLNGCQTALVKQLECAVDEKKVYAHGLVIREDFLERSDYNLQYKYGHPLNKVDYITIHNTYNSAPAFREREYLNRRQDKVFISFHFAVDENEAVQIMPLDVSAWHAGDGGTGDGNRKSVAIEICRSRCVGDEEILYRRSEKNAVILAALLLRRFDLPLSALKKHADWSKKNCPHRILDENRWDKFAAEVGEVLELLSSEK